eukprot:TRINITY_DN18410_c0_g1_i1.p1 TRINITY_DN18410_c0_g1~~TRINITY_DN18410_c0_g1_i1.p1  ORF type:complete len:112 (+),score=26.45 TRINITY_DN18410_c0_g1_i1:41-376(+)
MLRQLTVTVLVTLMTVSLVQCQGRCDIDERVKLALRTMNHQTVPAVVNCVLGLSSCDSTGSWIKQNARDGACGRRCGSNCTCREVQIRLIVRKMKQEFRDQWARIENHYRC